MKKQGDIASFFRNHAAKKQKFIASSLSPDVTQASTPQEQEKERINEEIMNPMPSAPPPPTLYDVSCLPHDPGERQPIASYHANDHDAIRRAYILRGPFQPYKGKGTSAFTSNGWNNWNKGPEALLKHVGSMSHKTAEEKYLGFINPNAAIDNKIEKWSDDDRNLYKIRLTYSLRCLKFLLHQGLSFRGHDESEESSNRGNFIEILKFLAVNSEEVNKYVLNNAPGNCTLTSPKIQKQIIQCCAIETRKKIIEELGEEPFAILADESSDISHKEQLALCLRYVDALGRPCEHFIGVVHVDDTSSLSLKDAIEALLVSHGLTLTRIRGQGYDGASNMRGDIKGLKTLIMQESPSAYYIHCFAHQLQLVLVVVAKGNNDCVWFYESSKRSSNAL
jgi:hypothetical protein